MKMIFINGKFLCQKVTGVQRTAIEIVKQFDLMDVGDVKFSIITPSKKYIVTNLTLKNIEIIQLKGKPNYYWEQIKLAKYCKKNKPFDLLNFCNIAPVLYPGSCFIHDLAWIDTPQSYSKKFRIVYNFIINRNIHRYKHIFTVSNFIKNKLIENYKIDNINVIYNSAEHMLNITEKKPNIDLPNEYYFCLGSSNPNKNFASIIECASKNPNYFFVISGNQHKSFKNLNYENFDNVVFTGYLNDSEISYLYKNCKAFLFPSLYEGFGIPPLEALMCGCKNVICNDIPVLHELYDGLVNFIDFSSQVNFNDCQKCTNLEYIKSKFNWKNSAVKVLNIIKN